MNNKTALICGISGQDGAYLAQLLLSEGYNVVGTSRDAQISSFRNLSILNIKEKVSLISMTPTDFRSVLQAVTNISPDEIYNLSGQSSVGLSFEQPVETLESIAIGTLNLLESVRFSGLPIKFYNAGSSECFGDTKECAADEKTPFQPKSPYAVAKSTAHWMVANYRDAYNLFACSGILFNHDSPLRPERFVTKKIIRAAVKISQGENIKLHLGNLDVVRDWGWAPDYVVAMWKMLQYESPTDFVIATGQSNSLKDFMIYTFQTLDLDWREFVSIDNALLRPSDIKVGKANPEKSEKLLAWKATNFMHDVIEKMVENEQQ